MVGVAVAATALAQKARLVSVGEPQVEHRSKAPLVVAAMNTLRALFRLEVEEVVVVEVVKFLPGRERSAGRCCRRVHVWRVRRTVVVRILKMLLFDGLIR